MADDSREDDDNNMVYLAFSEWKKMEELFVLNAFLHGRNIQSTNKKRQYDPWHQPGTQREHRFVDLNVDRWAD